MILHIVGNRPQFIKLAPLYHELQRRGYAQCILHSGQHYDENMSGIFFEELKIPNPDMNLHIGSGSHAEMTARAMVGFEKELQKRKPRIVILYGDTDTTLAGALAASKLSIPIAHVEGGLRTGDRRNPEELNRIVTDHLSDIIFCPDREALKLAKQEGMQDIAYWTGDIMYDTFLSIEEKYHVEYDDEIILMTWHRQENTCSKERMESILEFIQKLDGKIICPMHPRTVKCLKEFGLWEKMLGIHKFKIIEPVGYVEMVSYLQKAKLIVTDSGGLSKESSFAGAKCLFFMNLDVWLDLMKTNWILKVNPQDKVSVEKAMCFANKAQKIEKKDRPLFYGDGHAAEKMSDLLEKILLN